MQLGQLPIALGKEKKENLHVILYKTSKVEQLKDVIVLRNDNKVDNKVSENDKDERLKTIETYLETERENDPSLSPIVFHLIVTNEPMVLYPQALDVPVPSKKDTHRDDILQTFKQVKINLSFLEAIRQILTYANFVKDICTFKRKSKDDKYKRFF